MNVAHATWLGTSLAVKYSPTQSYYFSPRIEAYRDNFGYTTQVGLQGTTLVALTLTNSYTFTQGLEGRLELRSDYSTQPIFTQVEGSLGSNLFTATLAGLYKF